MRLIHWTVACGLLLSSLSIQAQETQSSSQSGEVAPATTVTGSGKQSYVPLWTGTSTVGNSKLFQTGGDIGVGTTAPKWALDVSGRVNTSVGYLIGGKTVLSLARPLSDSNIAVGYGAYPNNAVGSLSTAMGAYALNAFGAGAFETAVGAYALTSANGSDNDTAIGAYAMFANEDGEGNTAVGNFALRRDVHGSDNVAVGYTAGINISGDNNIDIGNSGAGADSGVVRIGTSGTQTSFFVAGVNGVATGSSDAVPVVIDSNGQLGTINSSQRFKEDIQDMGESSRGLMRLRPVTFRYRKAFDDGSKPLQYGLIAEQVAEVYPDLVVHSADGQVQTVKYQVLDSMLLNEVQRQQAEIQLLQARLAKMEAALASMSRTGNEQQGSTIPPQ